MLLLFLLFMLTVVCALVTSKVLRFGCTIKNASIFSCTSQNLIVPLHAIYNNKVNDFCSRVYTTKGFCTTGRILFGAVLECFVFLFRVFHALADAANDLSGWGSGYSVCGAVANEVLP